MNHRYRQSEHTAGEAAAVLRTKGCLLRLSARASTRFRPWGTVLLTSSPEQVMFSDSELARTRFLGRFQACTATLAVRAPAPPASAPAPPRTTSLPPSSDTPSPR